MIRRLLRALLGPPPEPTRGLYSFDVPPPVGTRALRPDEAPRDFRG